MENMVMWQERALNTLMEMKKHQEVGLTLLCVYFDGNGEVFYQYSCLDCEEGVMSEKFGVHIDEMGVNVLQTYLNEHYERLGIDIEISDGIFVIKECWGK